MSLYKYILKLYIYIIQTPSPHTEDPFILKKAIQNNKYSMLPWPKEENWGVRSIYSHLLISA